MFTSLQTPACFFFIYFSLQQKRKSCVGTHRCVLLQHGVCTQVQSVRIELKREISRCSLSVVSVDVPPYAEGLDYEIIMFNQLSSCHKTGGLCIQVICIYSKSYVGAAARTGKCITSLPHGAGVFKDKRCTSAFFVRSVRDEARE